MPATEDERNRFRRKLDATDIEWTDPEVDDLFTEIEARYPSGTREIVMAAALVSGVDELYVRAVKRVSYSQGGNSAQLSDIARGLAAWRDKLQAQLDKLLSEQLPVMRWGGMKKVPTRIEEFPDA